MRIEKAEYFAARAEYAFERIVSTGNALMGSILLLKPAFEQFEWALMTKAQRRRWCKRLIRNAKAR